MTRNPSAGDPLRHGTNTETSAAVLTIKADPTVLSRGGMNDRDAVVTMRIQANPIARIRKPKPDGVSLPVAGHTNADAGRKT